MTFYKLVQTILFSIQFIPFLTFGLNFYVPVCTAKKLVVNRYRNEILNGYIYTTITSLGHKRCLESCVEDCRCLSFQVCGFSNDCKLSNSSKTLNSGSAVEDSTSCDHFEFNYQDMMKPEVIFNIDMKFVHFSWWEMKLIFQNLQFLVIIHHYMFTIIRI